MCPLRRGGSGLKGIELTRFVAASVSANGMELMWFIPVIIGDCALNWNSTISTHFLRGKQKNERIYVCFMMFPKSWGVPPNHS